MLVGKVIGSATQITDANSVLIAQAIFEEFGKPAKERDETRLVKYMDLALKAKAQELRDKSNALATRRFFFDATKSALRELARLQKISDGPGDEREKIEKAMRILFGEEPRGFIPPTEQEAA